MEAVEKESLFLCMGSACHQMGIYQLLPALQALLKHYQLEDRLELKGAFCLGPCSHGIVMEFRSQLITDITLKNYEQKFIDEILSQLDPVEGDASHE